MAEETNWKLEAEKWKKKSLELGEKENVYVAKLKEAKEFIEKLTSPPLRQALIIRIGEDNVDIAYGNGNVDVVNYNPDLKGKLKRGQTVLVSPENGTIMRIKEKARSYPIAYVKDKLSDREIRILIEGFREKIVDTTIKDVKIGDSVLVDNSHNLILKNLGNTTKAYKLDKVPEVPWDAIGGLEQTIEELREAIEFPFVYKEFYARFPGRQNPKGALLYGPPGCGKTLLSKAVAYNIALNKQKKNGGELNGYFLYASGPEFLQKYVGEGEAMVRELFANGREASSENGDPVVICLDEPEYILRKRGTGISTDATDSLVNQFLAEIDGLKPLENLIVLLATNREDLMDPAILRPGRIDRKIYVPRPNKEASEKIFEIYLKDMPLDKELPDTNHTPQKLYAMQAASAIFDQTLPILNILYNDDTHDILEYKHIFSGASVVSIVSRAVDYAIKRGRKTASAMLNLQDILEAIGKEYLENRTMPNIATEADIKTIAKDKKIVDVEVLYRKNSY